MNCYLHACEAFPPLHGDVIMMSSWGQQIPFREIHELWVGWLHTYHPLCLFLYLFSWWITHQGNAVNCSLFNSIRQQITLLWQCIILAPLAHFQPGHQYVLTLTLRLPALEHEGWEWARRFSEYNVDHNRVFDDILSWPWVMQSK